MNDLSKFELTLKEKYLFSCEMAVLTEQFGEAQSYLRRWRFSHLLQKFPVLYGSRRFIIVFTTARYWILSCARWE